MPGDIQRNGRGALARVVGRAAIRLLSAERASWMAWRAGESIVRDGIARRRSLAKWLVAGAFGSGEATTGSLARAGAFVEAVIRDLVRFDWSPREFEAEAFDAGCLAESPQGFAVQLRRYLDFIARQDLRIHPGTHRHPRFGFLDAAGWHALYALALQAHAPRS